jgi:hypothetical protein
MHIISCDVCKKVQTADQFTSMQKGYWRMDGIQDICNGCHPLMEGRLNRNNEAFQEFHRELVLEAIRQVCVERSQA